jgi:hypothetical protein
MSRSKELGFTTFFINRFPEPMLNFVGRSLALSSLSSHGSLPSIKQQVN